MNNARDIALGIGVAVAALGVMFLPAGHGANPKRALSAFSNIADAGGFFTAAVILILVGVTIAIASRLIPRG